MKEKACPKLSGIDLDGKLVRQPCIEHECVLYQMVEGRHPQTGELVSEWDCAFNWTNVLLVENAKQQRHTQAAIESLRNLIATDQELVEIRQLPRVPRDGS